MHTKKVKNETFIACNYWGGTDSFRIGFKLIAERMKYILFFYLYIIKRFKNGNCNVLMHDTHVFFCDDYLKWIEY